MKAYLRAFVNYKQIDWAKLLPLVEFAYHNAKNASTGYILFELNCGFHPRISYKKDVDLCFKSKTADQLTTELHTLISVYRENLQHVQQLQKRYYNKYAKPRSYTPGDKVWLNSKYINTKRNCKLEFKFFGPFQVLHFVGKQVYKLELPKRWRIHDVFYMFLLEQNTTRKRQVDEKTLQLKFEDNDKGDEYEVEAIRDSTIYAKELESGLLPGLYYLISQKNFPEEGNTWEPAFAIQHLWRLFNTFYKENPNKSIAISTPVDTAPPKTRPTVKPGTRSNKQNQGQPAKANSTCKRSKKN